MRDLDHTSTNVQNNVKAYLNMLLNDLGYVGFRYDMVAGYSPIYTAMYNNSAQPQFSVGECWKTGSEIKTWIDGTKSSGVPTSAAFDFQFRYTVRNAINDNDWTKLGQANTGGGGYPLVSNNFESGSYKQWAVTFVENHDTQDRGNVTGYSKDPIEHDILAANAFMLAMPGTPCIFLPHWKAYSAELKNMIAARKAAGVTNTSTYSQSSSTASRYVVTTTGTKTTLICAVGSNVDTYAGPSNTVEILEGDNYKYFMPTSANLAWIDKPSGYYGTAFDVTLTAVSSSYTTLVYTTDGTTPAADNGTRVSGGSTVRVDESMTLKVALLNGNNVVSGSNAERSYTIPDPITVYLKDPGSSYGWTNVYYYSWDSDGENPNGTWPGERVTATKEIDGVTYYYFSYPKTSSSYTVNLVFNKGSNGNTNQTENLEGITEDVFFEITGGGNNNSPYTVDDITDQVVVPLTATVYFKDPGWEHVYYYSWDSNDSKALGSWPGTEITATTVIDGDTYYYHTFERADDNYSFNVIFSNGDGSQTNDITGITGDVYYKLGALLNNGKYEVLDPSDPDPVDPVIQFTPYDVTVYFKKPASGWDTVMMHAWGSDGTINNADGTTLNDDWPGGATTTVVIGGETWCYRTFTIATEGANVNVVINNNNNGKQTVDITGITETVYYELDTTTDGQGKYNVSETTPFEPYIATVYFKLPDDWDNVYFHSWDASTVLTTWPGTLSDNVKMIDGMPWYYMEYEITAEDYAVNIVINNGSGTQTVNIYNINSDRYYELGTTVDGEGHYNVVYFDDMTETITGVTLEYPAFRLGLGATFSLQATVSGTNVSTPITWTSSDPTVVSVSSGDVSPLRTGSNAPRRAAVVGGNITGLQSGVSTITAAVGGYSATCIVTVDSTTGVVDVSDSQSVARIVGGMLVIDTPVDGVVSILTVDGRERLVSVNVGSNTIEVPAGVLIVRIADKTFKLIN